MGLLTPKEVAAALRVSPATIKRWRFEGVGPRPIRITDRVVRYARAEIDRLSDVPGRGE